MDKKVKKYLIIGVVALVAVGIALRVPAIGKYVFPQV